VTTSQQAKPRIVHKLARTTRRHGHILRARVRRLLLTYTVIYLAAVATVIATNNHSLTAAALGLMVPGGGFLYASHWILAAAAFVLVVACLPLNPSFAPVVWVGSAAAAAYPMQHHMWTGLAWVIPLLPPIAIGAKWLWSRRSHAKALSRRSIVAESVEGRVTSTVRSQPAAIGEPLDDEALTDLRFVLDRALQPLDTFHGLHSREELTTGALRYQLSWAQQALAFYTYCRAPAFRGYLQEAQRNLILKMCDRRVWSYWFYENAVAHLELNADPIRRENIMYSGYLGTMLGLYEMTTGDQRFREPGSLALRWNKRTAFSYDAPRVTAAVRDNFTASRWCLFPCEPFLIYPVCNGFGMNSLLLEESLHPSGDPATFTQLLERYRYELEHEFTEPGGRFEGMLLTSWGMRLMLYGDVNDGMLAFLNHAAAPELAERSWEVLRFFGVERATTDDRFELHGADVDLGSLRRNVRPQRAAALTGVALGAAEMGDDEALSRILTELNGEYSATGPDEHEPRVDNLSNWARMNLAGARFLRPGGLYDAVHSGMPAHWRTGPILDEAPYPEVLVRRAVSDGNDLDLVLSAGARGATGAAGPQVLRIGQLRPGRTYRVRGADETQLVADHDGGAILHVQMSANSHVTVAPTA